MKRYAPLALLAVAVALSGCAALQPQPIERVEYVTGPDFRPFVERGFLFTIEGYHGEYLPAGMIEATIIPARRPDPSGRSRLRDGEVRVGGWIVQTVQGSEALELLYRQAREMGANAVTRFRMEALDAPETIQQRRTFVSYLWGVRVSGFAIQRVDDADHQAASGH